MVIKMLMWLDLYHGLYPICIVWFMFVLVKARFRICGWLWWSCEKYERVLGLFWRISLFCIDVGIRFSIISIQVEPEELLDPPVLLWIFIG